MGRPLEALVLSESERAELGTLAARRKTAQALALRARIVLLASDGMANKDVAARLDIDPVTVGKWRRRFLVDRLEGLRDEPRSGAPRTVEDARIEAVIVRTLESLPDDATHWSSRRMARASGLSTSTVQRIWRAFGLQPHRAETFKLSTDPDFVTKVRDIVGLYMVPPARALVLCVDEKSQIQALDRSQPLLPMRPGQIERRTHDYTRHGTTSLFAALDVATGAVIGRCYPRHRAPVFRDWLVKRPRWHVHHTPTGASWINQVERFFALLSERRIKRGAHRSVAALQTAITSFLDAHNADPKPFRWTKTADDILAAVERFCLRITSAEMPRTSCSGH